MRVLIVDDEPLARLSLERVLARRPDVEQFEAVASAQHALDRLESQPYDLMLLDIHMPGMSGIELIERLSKLSGPMPSIVFVTAHEEHAIEAFEKRVVDYVLKPFAPARVHEALDTAMRRSAHERAEQLLHALHELREHAPKSDTIAIKDKDRVVPASRHDFGDRRKARAIWLHPDSPLGTDQQSLRRHDPPGRRTRLYPAHEDRRRIPCQLYLS
jgi:DNA-binding LytR/AlgR family response regulator